MFFVLLCTFSCIVLSAPSLLDNAEKTSTEATQENTNNAEETESTEEITGRVNSSVVRSIVRFVRNIIHRLGIMVSKVTMKDFHYILKNIVQFLVQQIIRVLFPGLDVLFLAIRTAKSTFNGVFRFLKRLF